MSAPDENLSEAIDSNKEVEPGSSEAAEKAVEEKTGTVEIVDSPASAEHLENEDPSENEEAEQDGENTESTDTSKAVPAEADDKKIQEAVKFINETAQKILYDGYVKIGNYILDQFFDGDIELASSKDPTKPASFVKLCKRGDLTVHPSRLGLMVRVASQERFLLEKKVNTKPLLFTHKASLVKLKNNQDKINLIQECIKKKWTTRTLDRKISEILNLVKPEPYEALAFTTSKYIRKVDNALTLDTSALKIEDEILAKLPDDSRQELIGQIGILKTKVEESAAKSGVIAAECDALISKLGKQTDNGKNEAPISAQESTSTAPLK
jgi:hypothetical protein